MIFRLPIQLLAFCSTVCLFCLFWKVAKSAGANTREPCDEHTDKGMEEMLSTPLFVEGDGPSGSHGPEQQTASRSAPSPYRERYEVAARQHVSRQTNNLENELESMELEHLDL